MKDIVEDNIYNTSNSKSIPPKKQWMGNIERDNEDLLEEKFLQILCTQCNILNNLS